MRKVQVPSEEEVAKGRLDPVRKELYAKIVAEARDALGRYYLEYPDRLDGTRSKDGLEWSLRGIGRLLGLLDGYDITPKGHAKPSPKDAP